VNKSLEAKLSSLSYMFTHQPPLVTFPHCTCSCGIEGAMTMSSRRSGPYTLLLRSSFVSASRGPWTSSTSLPRTVIPLRELPTALVSTLPEVTGGCTTARLVPRLNTTPVTWSSPVAWAVTDRWTWGQRMVLTENGHDREVDREWS